MTTPQPDWLRRVVLVGTKKGGAGKSSVTAAVGAEAAAAGRRVLLIDGDPQGNLTQRDLGLEGDGGEGLTNTLLHGTPLTPLSTGRENLEIIPGGPHTSRAAAIDPDLPPEQTMTREQASAMREHFASALAELCAERRYHLVMIDTGPGDHLLMRTWLRAARYLIVPSPADSGSIDGIEMMSGLFTDAAKYGSTTRLLGVVLFAPGSRAGTRAVDETLAELTTMVGEQAGPFRSVIPNVKIAAEDGSALGVTPREMVAAITERNRSVIAALRSKLTPDDDTRRLRTKDPSKLITAYADLTREIFERIATHEKAGA